MDAGQDMDGVVATAIGWIGVGLRLEQQSFQLPRARLLGLRSATGFLEEVPKYSTDNRAAFDVLQAVATWHIDKRLAFTRHLAFEITERLNTPVHESQAVLYMTPVDICRAALAASIAAARAEGECDER